MIPGWDQASPKKAEDEARWQKRSEQVKDLRDAGGDWPRHQKTPDAAEHALGVWLHGQRIAYNQGKMAPEKEALLNEHLPGCREGRRRTGGRRRNSYPEMANTWLRPRGLPKVLPTRARHSIINSGPHVCRHPPPLHVQAPPM
ncbi:helicase associated domain-containing protein [Arthrobacter oryzae]|uniref:helicase associated domain-containing protein n=1 Tax=Arthrobacter oryzae TaxID=409290 RepID=UPI0027D82A67|nr:helicase associated domain-containing protein [Arthrobacter oryzae]